MEMVFRFTADTLLALLREAKQEHSKLTFTEPHDWSEWYADYMMRRLIATSHVSACDICDVAFGKTAIPQLTENYRRTSRMRSLAEERQVLANQDRLIAENMDRLQERWNDRDENEDPTLGR